MSRSGVCRWVITLYAFLPPLLTAQDFPFDRLRGAVPQVSLSAINHLDAVAHPIPGDTIRITSPGAARDCPDALPLRLTRLGNEIGSYFRDYYPLPRDERLATLGRVTMGPDLTGYLLLGDYSRTAVDLWIYDGGKERWRTPIELSDRWGDAYETYHADAFLVDVDRDGYRDVVKHGLFENFRPGYKEIYFDVTVAFSIREATQRTLPVPAQLEAALVALPRYVTCSP